MREGKITQGSYGAPFCSADGQAWLSHAEIEAGVYLVQFRGFRSGVPAIEAINAFAWCASAGGAGGRRLVGLRGRSARARLPAPRHRKLADAVTPTTALLVMRGGGIDVDENYKFVWCELRKSTATGSSYASGPLSALRKNQDRHRGKLLGHGGEIEHRSSRDRNTCAEISTVAGMVQDLSITNHMAATPAAHLRSKRRTGHRLLVTCYPGLPPCRHHP